MVVELGGEERRVRKRAKEKTYWCIFLNQPLFICEIDISRVLLIWINPAIPYRKTSKFEVGKEVRIQKSFGWKGSAVSASVVESSSGDIPK